MILSRPAGKTFLVASCFLCSWFLYLQFETLVATFFHITAVCSARLDKASFSSRMRCSSCAMHSRQSGGDRGNAATGIGTLTYTIYQYTIFLHRINWCRVLSTTHNVFDDSGSFLFMCIPVSQLQYMFHDKNSTRNYLSQVENVIEIDRNKDPTRIPFTSWHHHSQLPLGGVNPFWAPLGAAARMVGASSPPLDLDTALNVPPQRWRYASDHEHLKFLVRLNILPRMTSWKYQAHNIDA